MTKSDNKKTSSFDRAKAEHERLIAERKRSQDSLDYRLNNIYSESRRAKMDHVHGKANHTDSIEIMFDAINQLIGICTELNKR